MVKNIKKDIKDEKMKTKERGSHDLYDEPGVVGSLGGVAPYAKAQKISIAQVKKEFEKSFAYRLHKQGRWRGEFLPVVVFDIDEQWVTDLIKVQTLAKQNKGYRYILVVTDAFFKYAWAQSIKKETGKVWQIFLPRYSKKYKEGNPRRYRQIQAKNFTTWRFKSCYKRNTIEIVSLFNGCQYTQIGRHIAQTCQSIRSHLSQEYENHTN